MLVLINGKKKESKLDVVVVSKKWELVGIVLGA